MDETGKNAFFVGDLGKIVKKHSQWQNVVAQIKPFYTVKCNSTPAVLEILAALGIGFACSSKNEMALLQELGVSPENIIYISPCKQVSQIKYAAKIGVNIMTCDSEIELKKIARNHPNAKVLLHIATEDTIGGEEGSMKFGTTLKNCRHLLECAKELDVQIIGVKFHVSSACKESQVYVHALSDARCVFDMAGEFGFTMNMLDIGGGFTGTEFQLEEVNHVISPLLDIYFPEGSGIKIISEPGSYYVSSAFTLAVNIIAKKVVENDKFSSGGKTGSDEPAFMYYMNDGVYGSFASKLSEDLNTIPEVHKVLLHIATEDTIGGEEGSMKFGTTLKNCRHLLECAKELDVQIIGVKFHVSSACKESQVYVHALSDARCVFDMAGEFGFTMNMLDIGGGSTGTEFQLEEVNHVISPLLDIYFPEGSGIKIISEPGSYYVSSAFTLAVNIIAKKVVENDKFSSGVGKTGSDEPAFMYYMNDGVYGSFASKLSEDLNTIPEVHKKYKEDEPLFTSSLWGPSCDELDQIVENCLLPELNVGDWLIFDNMGADSFHEPSAFNDFQRPAIYYMMSFSDWYEMQDAGITSDTMMKNFFFVPSCIQLSQEDSFSTEA
ncbi:Hypothetical predicted protein [Marmota monax]|uniref:Antizyme inhibitor 1 n=1 Tax=Marmota monax TaxID=9995 RepID=A0A5E4ALV5_MARMO|nr:Hypothetical predicted protein [Marmota monax]